MRQARHADVADGRAGAFDGVRGAEDLLKQGLASPVRLQPHELGVEPFQQLHGLGQENVQLFRRGVE